MRRPALDEKDSEFCCHPVMLKHGTDSTIVAWKILKGSREWVGSYLPPLQEEIRKEFPSAKFSNKEPIWKT